MRNVDYRLTVVFVVYDSNVLRSQLFQPEGD